VVTDTVTGKATRFFYDPDGNLVKLLDGRGTLAIAGPHFEQRRTGAGAGLVVTNTSYYYFGGQTVAMSTTSASSVYWLHTDHLGSVSAATDPQGQAIGGGVRYDPFGIMRFPEDGVSTLPTDRLFTGQRWLPEVGLYHFGALLRPPPGPVHQPG
jgi:hypothetical protein